MLPMSAAQASSVTTHPSISEHGNAAILFDDVAGVVLTGKPAKHHDELVPLGTRRIFCVRIVEGRQLLRKQWMWLPWGEFSHGVVQPVMLPIRRPFVPIRGHGANNSGFVREVQAAKLAVLLHGIVPLLFVDGATLVVDLVRRGETFGGGFDLRGPADPHIHRKA
jgi:hypothetical protein